jgi:hypothetical protein
VLIGPGERCRQADGRKHKELVAQAALTALQHGQGIEGQDQQCQASEDQQDGGLAGQ